MRRICNRLQRDLRAIERAAARRRAGADRLMVHFKESNKLARFVANEPPHHPLAIFCSLAPQPLSAASAIPPGASYRGPPFIPPTRPASWSRPPACGTRGLPGGSRADPRQPDRPSGRRVHHRPLRTHPYLNERAWMATSFVASTSFLWEECAYILRAGAGGTAGPPLAKAGRPFPPRRI